MTADPVVRLVAIASLLVAASAAGIDDAVVVADPPAVMTPMTGVDTRGAALLMAAPDRGEIDGALTWSLTEAQGERTGVELTFVVEVDGEGLLVGSPPDRVEIEVVAYLLDDSGGLTAHVASEMVLEGADGRGRVLDAGLKHRGGISVSRGRYSLRVLVRNRATDRYCLIRRELDVDLDGAGAPTLMPPMVAEPTDRWLRTLQPDLKAADRPDDPTDSRVWPSARPTWRADRPLAVVVAGSAVGDGPGLEVRVEDPAGRTVLEPGIRLAGTATAGSGSEAVEVEVEAPGLPAGAYRLVVTADAGDRTVDRSLAVWIHDRPEQLAWTDLTEVRVEADETDVTDENAPSVAADGQREEPTGQTTTYPAVTPAASYSGEPQVAVPIPGVDARGAALLMSGQSGGEIAGAVTWTVVDDDVRTDGAALRVFVEVDGRSLLADTAIHTVPVEIVIYLFDDRNELIAHVASGILLDTDDEIGGVLGSGLKHVGELIAPGGRSSLRVLVRNRVSGRYFIQRRDIDLDLGGEGLPALVPPIVAEPDDRWVKSVQTDLARVGIDAADPLQWPSARPAWRSDQPLAVTLEGTAVADGRPIVARLEDRLGQAVLEPRLRLGNHVARDSRLGLVDAELEAPDLPGGEYRLVLFVGDREEERASERLLMVSIHGRPEELAWTDLIQMEDAGELHQLVATDGITEAEVEHESMRAAYRAALRAWVDGDWVTARRVVNELEGPIADSDNTSAWRRLVAAEGSVLSETAATRPEVLIAAVLLHREMYQWYLARGEGALARHSWESAATLAIEAEDLDGWQPPDGFVEGVLLDIADRLVRSRQPHSARHLLDAAAEIAPTSPRPLLALGALAERTGHPDEAIPPLKRLVELEPDDLEARLRLAVCLARDGEVADAQEMLGGLLAQAVTPWIRTLAFQELGSLLIDTHQSARAVELLLDASAEIPDNQRLRILLAYALDANGQPRQAASVLEGVNWVSTGADESARYRYSKWPTLDRSQLRTALAEAESIARNALREALL